MPLTVQSQREKGQGLSEMGNLVLIAAGSVNGSEGTSRDRDDEGPNHFGAPPSGGTVMKQTPKKVVSRRRVANPSFSKMLSDLQSANFTSSSAKAKYYNEVAKYYDKAQRHFELLKKPSHEPWNWLEHLRAKSEVKMRDILEAMRASKIVTQMTKSTAEVTSELPASMRVEFLRDICDGLKKKYPLKDFSAFRPPTDGCENTTEWIFHLPVEGPVKQGTLFGFLCDIADLKIIPSDQKYLHKLAKLLPYRRRKTDKPADGDALCWTMDLVAKMRKCYSTCDRGLLTAFKNVFEKAKSRQYQNQEQLEAGVPHLLADVCESLKTSFEKNSSKESNVKDKYRPLINEIDTFNPKKTDNEWTIEDMKWAEKPWEAVDEENATLVTLKESMRYHSKDLKEKAVSLLQAKSMDGTVHFWFADFTARIRHPLLVLRKAASKKWRFESTASIADLMTLICDTANEYYADDVEVLDRIKYFRPATHAEGCLAPPNDKGESSDSIPGTSTSKQCDTTVATPQKRPHSDAHQDSTPQVDCVAPKHKRLGVPSSLNVLQSRRVPAKAYEDAVILNELRLMMRQIKEADEAVVTPILQRAMTLVKAKTPDGRLHHWLAALAARSNGFLLMRNLASNTERLEATRDSKQLMTLLCDSAEQVNKELGRQLDSITVFRPADESRGAPFDNLMASLEGALAFNQSASDEMPLDLSTMDWSEPYELSADEGAGQEWIKAMYEKDWRALTVEQAYENLFDDLESVWRAEQGRREFSWLSELIAHKLSIEGRPNAPPLERYVLIQSEKYALISYLVRLARVRRTENPLTLEDLKLRIIEYFKVGGPQ